MRTIHRVISLFVVLFMLYLGVTGTIVQTIDLKSLFLHVPATDPDMMAMREDKDGPDNYVVLEAADYTASSLPANLDVATAVFRLLEETRTRLSGAALDYAEVRMEADDTIGRAKAGPQMLKYNFRTGESVLSPAPEPARGPPVAVRNDFKHLHRMTTFGDWALWINPVVGLALVTFVVTGLVMYWQLLKARRRIKRPQWFWYAGDWWRTLHRWISLVSSVILIVVALSGAWLAVESLVFGFYLRAHLPRPGQPFERAYGVTPLTDAQVPQMLARTLDAKTGRLLDPQVKVLRLRNFGTMAQAVIVSGRDDATRQTVINAATGKTARLTEPGYPETGFPFGWQAHQIAKQIHRGSYFGMSGRLMDWLGGLALIYLSISGVVMYVRLWTRRRLAGRPALLWT